MPGKRKKGKKKEYDRDDAMRYIKAHPNFEQTLVNTVRSYPSIWYPDDEEYHKVRCHREHFFENVSQDLLSDGYNVSAAFAKDHWEYLRAFYSRKRRPLPSSSNAAKAKIAERWPLFMTMDFLWDITDSRGDKQRKDGDDDDDDENNSGGRKSSESSGAAIAVDGEADAQEDGVSQQKPAATAYPEERNTAITEPAAWLSATTWTTATAGSVKRDNNNINERRTSDLGSSKRLRMIAPKPALPSAMDNSNEPSSSSSEDGVSEAMGNFVAAQLRSLRSSSSPDTRDWLIKAIHDLVYVVKAAD